MLILGIDPGATGAAGLIGTLSLLAHKVEDLDGDPAVVVERLDSLIASAPVLDRTRDFFAMVERAQAMPKQGLASTAKYMTGYGVILGYLHTRGIPYDTVRPGEWKKALGLKAGDKDASLALARRLFPNMELGRKKDHGRAEALLIAEWARRARFGKVNQ